MKKNRKRVAFSLLGLCLMFAGSTIAQGPPERDIDPHRHPILADAQRLCDQAYNRVSDAQRANQWDMRGHAAKAKALLEQASRELKAAAMADNRHGR
ncbi:MAG TPA: hypothetical protein VN753_10485 [Terracidiphilus sp.]|nr:hypothetical protein [Terracidiphilus sp.]